MLSCVLSLRILFFIPQYLTIILRLTEKKIYLEIFTFSYLTFVLSQLKENLGAVQYQKFFFLSDTTFMSIHSNVP